MRQVIYLILLLCGPITSMGYDHKVLESALLDNVSSRDEIAKQYVLNHKLNEKTRKEQIDYITIAAEKGDAESQWMLYYAYDTQWNIFYIPKNNEKATYWLSKLASNSDITNNKDFITYAQRKLGECYEFGWLGLEENISASIKWHKKAAFNGDSLAACDLGRIYKYIDKQEAIYWFKKSMDIYWKKYHEEDDIVFDWLRDLGVTYHPADHVGHRHAELTTPSMSSTKNPSNKNTAPQATSSKSSNSNTAKASSQSQESQVKAYTETVPVTVWQPCGACNNSGQCQVCFGQGWTYSNSSYNGKRECSACHWSGKCTICGGRGGQNVTRYEQRTVYR